VITGRLPEHSPLGKGHCTFDGKTEGRAADNVEREVRADVRAGQANHRHDSQREGTPRWAEPLKSGSAKCGCNASVARQVPEP